MAAIRKAAETRTLLVGLLVVHASLLAWSGYLHSPTFNEVGHLPAGLSNLSLGRFELYRANPPLVRCIAALPVVLAGAKTDWTHFDNQALGNSVVRVAMDFVATNGYRSFWLYALARWACIPFSLLGAWLCFRLAGDLYGAASGNLAAVLWCFSPDILGHGATIMPDVPAAAFALAMCFALRRWLMEPIWYRATVLGVVLGLAELTKYTLLVLYPIAIVLWLCCRTKSQAESARLSLRREAGMLFGACVLSLAIINLGYGFEGSFRPLGKYEFQSRLLTGAGAQESRGVPESNRFRNSWVGRIPVPLPNNYLQGIDKQKADFQQGMRSYLHGQWRDRGWWYFYLYAMALKVPLGTWCLVALAVVATATSRTYSPSWRNELFLMLPAAAVLLLVSSQTGFSIHSRYVFPVYPFLFVWTSKVARAFEFKHRAMVLILAASLLWSVWSSLNYFPHSLSYFSELCGGPKGGAYHLLDSGIAWGQDLLLLKDWYNRHSEARPFHLVSFGWVDPRIVRIEFRLPPVGPSSGVGNVPSEEHCGPQPGWHAVDVNYLHGSDWPVHDGNGGMYWPAHEGLNFEYFLRFQPIAMAGYSIYIYHITPEEANRVRREMGLPELTGSEQSIGAAPRNPSLSAPLPKGDRVG